MPHTVIVHHQQHHIGFGSTNLKPDASALHAHRRRRTPATATFPAAYRKAAAIFGAEYKAGLLHSRNHHDATRLVDEIVGNAPIVGLHHVGQRLGRSVQPVVNLDFPIRCESGGSDGTGQRQNPCVF